MRSEVIGTKFTINVEFIIVTYIVMSRLFFTNYASISLFNANYFIYSFYTMHFLPRKSNTLVEHNSSVKSLFLVRLYYCYIYVYENLRTCSKRIFYLFPVSFIHLMNRKRNILKKTNFWSFLTALFPVQFLT